MAIRPLLKVAIVSRHFIKDMKDEEEIKSIVNDILDCSNMDFFELHKPEENNIRYSCRQAMFFCVVMLR
jgi:hypothetical protein